MATPGMVPLRPSLSRANASANSIPRSDQREKSNARTGMAKSPHSSSHGPLMSSPPYQAKGMLASEMLRTESSESHRSLRSKSSRKELRDLQRSASPMAPPSSTSSKHKYSRSWEDESNDDDARSINSFTCPFAAEFDAKQRNRAEYGEQDGSSRQRFMDAVFRKLSQKTGIHQRESKAWAAANETIREEQSEEKSTPPKVAKVKPHFLDLSSYISPVPASPNAITSNLTPRPSDFERFTTGYLSPDQIPHQSKQQQQQPQRPTLRSRRSADTLGESRRLQREEWSAVALNSARGAATAESVRSPHGGLTVGQTMPSGMSHALLARATNSTSTSGSHTPVPSLPVWAQTNNRSLHSKQSSPGRPVDLQRMASHDGLGHAPRSAEMGRAASHDASIHLHNRPARPVFTSRGVSGPVRGSADQQGGHAIPASLQIRSQAKVSRPQVVSPLSPLSPQWPRSAHSLTEEGGSPITPNVPNLHRGSMSSAASDSGASSCISSVPQTPTSRPLALAYGSLHSYGYGDEEEIEMTAEEENSLLSGVGPYRLEDERRQHYYAKSGAPQPTMTPKSSNRKLPHIASLFDSTDTRVPPSSVATTPDEEEGNTTVRASRVKRRPRASTMSEQSPSKTIGQGTTSVPSQPGQANPLSPSRSSSLLKNKARDSVVSSASTSTTSSNSTSSSNSESILSYAKGSPTFTDGSPIGSPQSSGRHASNHSNSGLASSPRKRPTTSKAEDWASSIGRRFAKGSLKSGSPTIPVTPHLDAQHA